MFMYNEKLGWNWHKGWNLPAISIHAVCSSKLEETPAFIEMTKNLYVKIIACKFSSESDDTGVKLINVGLKGVHHKPLNLKEPTSFKSLRFRATSFTNQGVRFHLIIGIFLKTEHSNGQEQLIESYLSPPIYIDARKSSRESYKIKKLKQITYYFEPFQPQSLGKDYNSKKHMISQNVINNDAQGLCDYLSAPNIKNKVKHPLFLVLKFSHCVKLYYNGLKLQATSNSLKISEMIISKLQSILYSIQSGYRGDGKQDSSKEALEEKEFIIVFKESVGVDSIYFTKTISDYIQIVKHPKIIATFNEFQIPEYFKPVSETDLETSYRRLYQYLFKLKFKLKMASPSQPSTMDEVKGTSADSEPSPPSPPRLEASSMSQQQMPIQINMMPQQDPSQMMQNHTLVDCSQGPSTNYNSVPVAFYDPGMPQGMSPLCPQMYGYQPVIFPLMAPNFAGGQNAIFFPHSNGMRTHHPSQLAHHPSQLAHLTAPNNNYQNSAQYMMMDAMFRSGFAPPQNQNGNMNQM
jgi:ribosomal protein L29